MRVGDIVEISGERGLWRVANMLGSRFVAHHYIKASNRWSRTPYEFGVSRATVSQQVVSTDKEPENVPGCRFVHTISRQVGKPCE